MKNTQDTILEKITEGSIDMKSRWHFILKTVLFVFTTLLVALITMYVTSLVGRILQETGVLQMPGFGVRGTFFFLGALPWVFIALSLACVLSLYALLRNRPLFYRNPIAYLLLALVLFVATTSIAMHLFAAHERIERFAEQHHVPGLAPMYRNITTPPEGLLFGTISGTTTEGVFIEQKDGTTLHITLLPETRIHPAILLLPGEEVVILSNGTTQEGAILAAYGIRPAEPKMGKQQQTNPQRPRRNE